MALPVYIVDTGYLLALLDVPGETQAPAGQVPSKRAKRFPPREPSEAEEVERRFAKAVASGAEIIVPLAVLYEVASHINDIDGSRQVAKRYAAALLQLVSDSLRATPASLFQIEPRPELTEFMATLGAFAHDHVLRNHSLVDTALVRLAEAKKAEAPHREVYIWTWERRRNGIRSCSPDVEADPFPSWVD